jgi:hypothetical protein
MFWQEDKLRGVLDITNTYYFDFVTYSDVVTHKTF